MIKNDHQLEVTKAQVEKFAKAIEEVKMAQNMHPVLQLSYIKSMEDQLEELREEIRVYELQTDH